MNGAFVNIFKQLLKTRRKNDYIFWTLSTLWKTNTLMGVCSLLFSELFSSFFLCSAIFAIPHEASTSAAVGDSVDTGESCEEGQDERCRWHLDLRYYGIREATSFVSISNSEARNFFQRFSYGFWWSMFGSGRDVFSRNLMMKKMRKIHYARRFASHMRITLEFVISFIMLLFSVS